MTPGTCLTGATVAARRDTARSIARARKRGRLSAYIGALLTIASSALTVAADAHGERRILISGACQHMTPNGAGIEDFKEASGEFVAQADAAKLCTKNCGSGILPVSRPMKWKSPSCYYVSRGSCCQPTTLVQQQWLRRLRAVRRI